MNTKIDPPFKVFRELREIAVQNVGQNSVLDMSQGEPGYGFSPSFYGRRMASFITLLDSEINNNFQPSFTKSFYDEKAFEEKIKNIIQKNYSQEVGKEIEKDWEKFVLEVQKNLQKQNLDSSKKFIFEEIFNYSILTGGRYPQPHGGILLRSILANKTSKELKKPVSLDEIILVSGASHGISVLMKTLGAENLNYLKPGDYALSISPSYSPYNQMFEERGVNIIYLNLDPKTGKIEKSEFEKILKDDSLKIKVMTIIDPNNPSGFALEKDFVENITKIAEKHNSIIITDEVYSDFFDNYQSLASTSLAERVIRINSMSKIERSTGLRVGEIYLSKVAENFINQNVLRDFLSKDTSFKNELENGTSVGGMNIGLFHHITGLPGVSTLFAICNLILGEDETQKVKEKVQKNAETFYKGLGLNYLGNNYYGIVDLGDLTTHKTMQKTFEEKLILLAKKGLVVMPTFKFFNSKENQNFAQTIRVSFPNVNLEGIKKATKILQETL